MDIHKPKPWHGVREFLKEYVIIVVGVLTALGAEQGVEWLHWRHKTHLAEQAVGQEVSVDAAFAQEVVDLTPCANRFFDAVQSAIDRNRPDLLGRIFMGLANKDGGPFAARVWTQDSWSSALSGQVGDHLPAEDVRTYSRIFSLVGEERSAQAEMILMFGDVASARFGRLDTPSVAMEELRAVERLRMKQLQRHDMAGGLLRRAKALGIRPSRAESDEAARGVAVCEAEAARLPPP